MPSPVGAALAVASKLWPLLVKYGPKVVGAVTLLTKFVADNPRIPAWFRERMTDLPKRLSDVQKRHGDAAKIRGTLEIIRDVAQSAQQAGESLDAADYTARADRIERGLRLVEAKDRADRKPMLAKLKSDTDDLLAEVLQAVTGGGGADRAPGDQADPGR